MRTLALIVLFVAACSPSRTPGPDQAFVSPFPDHTKFTDPCSTCHEGTRLAPTENVAHGFGRDCAECHKYDLTTPASWKPVPFAHQPKPTACLGCHAGDRSTAATHPKTGDCVTCHHYPTWIPAVP